MNTSQLPVAVIGAGPVGLAAAALLVAVAAEGVRALCADVLRLPGLALDGLMTIGALAGDPEAARPGFRLLREVRDDVAARLGVELPHLSMGMSDDFAVAVEEGSTLMRLGRVLFGTRGPAAWREG